MKKLNVKTIGIAAAAAALFVLAGCGESGTASVPPESLPAQELAAPQETAGTLLLSVNPAIELDYDMAGDVLAAELVGEIDEAGYFDTTVAGNERNIVLRLERGSEQPEGFLADVEASVRQAVSDRGGTSRPVAIGADDFNNDYADRGYISSDAAERLVAAQTGVQNPQFVVKEYELDDGDYEVELVIDGVEYEFEVDAYTGRVTEVERDDGRDDYLDDIYDDRDDIYDDDRWEDDFYDDDWDDRYDDDWDDDWDDDDDDDDDDDWDDDWDDDDDDDWDDDWDD